MTAKESNCHFGLTVCEKNADHERIIYIHFPAVEINSNLFFH